jgi:PAS domain S-box-containing protein
VPVKMVGTVADVTEKAQLILKLKESEELNKQAQALTNTGNWKWSIENDSIDWSDEMYRIYGLIPQSEKITFQRFLTFIHDEDRSRRLAEITQALKIGKSSDYIMRIVAADGKQKVLKGKSEVLLDKNKNPIGMLGTCQDITNEYYLTNELKKKNKELLRKNKDLESFNFIASHDLQEPLRKIQLYSNRIMNEGENAIPDHLLKYFEKIAQASNRMQQMIEDFLIFYQYMNTAEKPEPVDLTALLSEVINESNEIIQRKRADVIIDQLPSVIGIKLHLKQMLKHLLSNALKYSKKDEPPYIKITGNIQSTEGGASYLNLSISDNGIGFEQKYTDRIFELFQRLHSKDEYTGSGIGLSLCKKIAEDHGGFISVTSEVSKGSVFTVHLPH